MPLQTQLIGQRTLPRIHVVESRWTMAYAAGLQDDNLKLLDTTQASIAVHPLFPVCLEWPSVLDSRALPGQDCLTNEELARGVHATHDLHLLKRLVPGQAYQTTATVVDLQSGRQGARVCLQLDTLDEADELVARTWQTNVSRGVAIEGPLVTPIAQAPAWPQAPQAKAVAVAAARIPISVSAGLGNVYTETARIYNPIHSDRAFALAAGLPDIILHGTASLALAVSALVNRCEVGFLNREQQFRHHVPVDAAQAFKAKHTAGPAGEGMVIKDAFKDLVHAVNGRLRVLEDVVFEGAL